MGILVTTQHLASIGAAKRVVVINADDQAPIFGVADMRVVENASMLIDALLDNIKSA